MVDVVELRALLTAERKYVRETVEWINADAEFTGATPVEGHSEEWLAASDKTAKLIAAKYGIELKLDGYNKETEKKEEKEGEEKTSEEKGSGEAPPAQKQDEATPAKETEGTEAPSADGLPSRSNRAPLHSHLVAVNVS